MEGGTAHAKRNFGVYGVPPPTYIKGGGEEAGPRGRAKGGSPTWTLGPSRIRPPPFLSGEGGKGKEVEEKKERGAGPPPQFGLGLGGAPLLLAASSLFH